MTEPQCFMWRAMHSGKVRTINMIYLGERQREREHRKKQEERGENKQEEKREGGGGKRCGGWRFVIAYSRLLAGRGPLSAFREGALRLPSPLQKPHTNKQENIFNRRQSKMMNWWWRWGRGPKNMSRIMKGHAFFDHLVPLYLFFFSWSRSAQVQESTADTL